MFVQTSVGDSLFHLTQISKENNTCQVPMVTFLLLIKTIDFTDFPASYPAIYRI
jgi:hypothetical protein